MGIEVNLDDETDRWRWCCPNGHRNRQATNHHFWCEQCARRHDAAGEFQERHDRAERTVGREELTLLTEAGPYREVYGRGGAP
jgi:hypothetical protein